MVPVQDHTNYYYLYIFLQSHTITTLNSIEGPGTLHHFTPVETDFNVSSFFVLDDCCSALFNLFDSYQPVCVF